MTYILSLVGIRENYYNLKKWVDENSDIANIIYVEWEAPGQPGWMCREASALQVVDEQTALMCMLKFNLKKY